jgi:DNA-3-methyladenine glycosylase II
VCNGTLESTTLTTVPGIGPWSAGLVLLRGLGRMAVFPSGDVGACRNLAHLLELDSSTPSADLQPHIDRMDSMKGFLYFYALGWRILREGLITPVTDPA